MTKVKLLTSASYTGMDAVVGKTFEAEKDGDTWDIKVGDLVAAGYVTDGSTDTTLCWPDFTVEVIDG